MVARIILYCFTFLLIPLATGARDIDTSSELKNLVSIFKGFDNISYDYIMDGTFPGGEKDHIKGNIYIDTQNKLYYNNCDAFLMLYSANWYYKADHRKKLLTLIKLDKVKNKKQLIATENGLFRNSAVSKFLDSVVMKKAKTKYINLENGLLHIILGFPKTEAVQKMDIIFDKKDSMLVSYSMSVIYPLPKTQKGLEVIETSIKCTDFKNKPEKNKYEESNYFSYDDKKLEVKKYKNYKLSCKT